MSELQSLEEHIRNIIQSYIALTPSTNMLISLMKILSDFEHVDIDRILRIFGIDDTVRTKLVNDILKSINIGQEKVLNRIFENLTFLQNLVSRICETLERNNVKIEECTYEEVTKGWERAWYSRLSSMIIEANIKGEIEIKIAPLTQEKSIIIDIGKVFHSFLDIIKELLCKDTAYTESGNFIIIDLEHVIDNLINKLIIGDLSTDPYIRDVVKNHVKSFIKYKIIPEIFECLGIAKVDNYNNKEVIVFTKGFVNALYEKHC